MRRAMRRALTHKLFLEKSRPGPRPPVRLVFSARSSRPGPGAAVAVHGNREDGAGLLWRLSARVRNGLDIGIFPPPLVRITNKLSHGRNATTGAPSAYVVRWLFAVRRSLSGRGSCARLLGPGVARLGAWEFLAPSCSWRPSPFHSAIRATAIQQTVPRGTVTPRGIFKK